MDFSFIVSEDRIKRAYKDGEFDNLPGYGKPLNLEDLSAVPEELRMAYQLLKNSGFSPEGNKLRQEVMTIEDLIRKCENPEEKEQLSQQLGQKLLKYNKLMSSRGGTTNSSVFKNYEPKIQNKLL
ncbi:DUF1992 domain-containing protein [Heyndrickxia sp. MSNUG]|uniref:DnaJ family domain-containing protein n=1 Tax=Heyndrickxia sp. MSNUG TaxID=3136677 RepID=UPI003C2E24AF